MGGGREGEMIHLFKSAYRWIRAIVFVLLSPILEKNASKVLSVDAPVVISMSRCIVAALAWGMFLEIKKAGIVGWPEATFAIGLVYALPILHALDKSKPEDVLAFGRSMLERFGVGETRKIGSIIPADDPETKVDRSAEVVPHAPPA
jgi:hypothetical protein